MVLTILKVQFEAALICTTRLLLSVGIEDTRNPSALSLKVFAGPHTLQDDSRIVRGGENLPSRRLRRLGRKGHISEAFTRCMVLFKDFDGPMDGKPVGKNASS